MRKTPMNPLHPIPAMRKKSPDLTPAALTRARPKRHPRSARQTTRSLLLPQRRPRLRVVRILVPRTCSLVT